MRNSLSSKPDDAETGKPEEEGTAKPDAQNTEAARQEGDGEAYSEGDAPISNKKKGDLGENQVVTDLATQGYTEVLVVQNRSGHGVDIIARNPETGNVKCIEVKTNTSRLSSDQAKGGKVYVNDRLDRAVNARGHYKVPPNRKSLPEDAQQAKDWIEDAPKVEYEVHRVPVDNTTGTTGVTKISPWDPKP